MNPAKPKKQSSRTNQVAKMETSFLPSYIQQATFNQTLISNQQQMIQTSQAIQN